MGEDTFKICVVSPLYHLSLGGLGRQAVALTEMLAERGLNVFVVTRKLDVSPCDFKDDVPIFRVWALRPKTYMLEDITLTNILISISFSISCALLLFKKRRDYTIVHFHGASIPLFINLPILKFLGKKVIAKVAAAKLGAEAGSLKGKYSIFGFLLRIALKRVNVFVAISKEIEEGLLEDGILLQRIQNIPNFVDTKIFSPAKKEKIKENLNICGKKCVIYSGRLVARKGIEVLLLAWKDVLKIFPEARLIIIGEGPLERNLKNMADQLDVENTVGFIGRVDNIIDYLHATDIFVLPSFQEGLPNSLLEAMACRLPVVATRIGGVVDVVKDGENGILVNPGDSNDLTEGLLRLLKDDELAAYIALNAYKTIRNSYSIDSIATRYIELYRQLLKA